MKPLGQSNTNASAAASSRKENQGGFKPPLPIQNNFVQNTKPAEMDTLE